MKKCPKCGENFNNDVDFCINCGIKLQYANENQNIANNEAPEWIGIDMDERIIAKLGNGYFKNIITTGDVSKVNAILTKKRLYLSGKSYEISKGILTSYKVSKVINIEDITGTGFIYVSNIRLILFSILFFIAALITINSLSGLAIIFLLIALALFTAFFITQKSIFKIEYAGGSIGFDVKWLDVNESVIFQKKIYQVKDKRKKEIIQESLKEK